MAFYLNSSTQVLHKYFIGKLSLTAPRESMIRAIGKTSLKACEQKEIDIFYLLTVAFRSHDNPDVVCWIIGNTRPRTENNLCKLFRSLPFRACRITFHPKHRVPPHAILRQLYPKFLALALNALVYIYLHAYISLNSLSRQPNSSFGCKKRTVLRHLISRASFDSAQR